jgi:hypothetical protein
MPFGIGFDHRRDFLQRLIEHVDEQQKPDKAADRQAALGHIPRPHQQDHHLQEPHPEEVERQGDRHDLVGGPLDCAVLGVVDGKERLLVLLVGKGPHDPRPAHVFLDPGVEGAHPLELRAEVEGHLAAIAKHQPEHAGRDGRGHEGERRVDHEHQHEGAQKGHDRDEQVFGAMVRHFADFLEILGQAADQMPGLLFVEKAHGQGLQMLEGAAAHFRLDRDAEDMPPISDDRHQGRVEQVDRQQPNRRQHDQPPVAARQERVDEDLHRQRKAQRQKPGQHRAAEVDQKQPPMRRVIAEEVLEHGQGFLIGG